MYPLLGLLGCVLFILVAGFSAIIYCEIALWLFPIYDEEEIVEEIVEDIDYRDQL